MGVNQMNPKPYATRVHLMSDGNFSLINLTSCWSSKCCRGLTDTTCAIACTPLSVRDACVQETRLSRSAISSSGRARYTPIDKASLPIHWVPNIDNHKTNPIIVESLGQQGVIGLASKGAYLDSIDSNQSLSKLSLDSCNPLMKLQPVVFGPCNFRPPTPTPPPVNNPTPQP